MVPWRTATRAPRGVLCSYLMHAARGRDPGAHPGVRGAGLRDQAGLISSVRGTARIGVIALLGGRPAWPRPDALGVVGALANPQSSRCARGRADCCGCCMLGGCTAHVDLGCTWVGLVSWVCAWCARRGPKNGPPSDAHFLATRLEAPLPNKRGHQIATHFPAPEVPPETNTDGRCWSLGCFRMPRKRSSERGPENGA